MQYVGGKYRICKFIQEIVNKYTEDKPFVSLFCGSCWIESKVKAPIRICNDANRYLIEMWKAFQCGEDFYSTYNPLLSKEDYEYIKNHKDEMIPVTALAGFGCSYGGKWFDAYVGTNSRGDNYWQNAIRSCLKKIKTMQDVQFTNRDYRDVEIPENAVIYADPPYEGCIDYKAIGKFDCLKFWEYMRELSKNHLIFISEYNAPDDFICVWQKDVAVSVEYNNNNRRKVEKLFIHKCNEEVYYEKQK